MTTASAHPSTARGDRTIGHDEPRWRLFYVPAHAVWRSVQDRVLFPDYDYARRFFQEALHPLMTDDLDLDVDE